MNDYRVNEQGNQTTGRVTRWAVLSMLSMLLAAGIANSLPVPCAAAENSARDIFSTPDATAAPVFTARIKQTRVFDPLFGPNGETPTRDAIRAIPSITGPQLKRLDELIFQSRDAAQPMQDELASLHRLQEQRKQQKNALAASQTGPNHQSANAIGADEMAMSMSMLADASGQETNAGSAETDESIKNHIDVLNEQLKELNGRLWPNIRAMLSPEQLNELGQMRNGQLVIAKNAPTDLPEPPPDHPVNAKPGAPGRPAPPAPRPFAHPPSAQPHLVKPLIYSTQQLIYRNLWRL